MVSGLRGPGSGSLRVQVTTARATRTSPTRARTASCSYSQGAYRPAFFDASGLASGIVITSDAAVLNGNPIPPGGVVSLLDGIAALDDVSFQAASATQAASSPAEISLRKLRQLGGQVGPTKYGPLEVAVEAAALRSAICFANLRP